MANPNLPPGLGVPTHYQQMFQRVEQPQQQQQADPYKRLGANQYGPSVSAIAKGSLVWFRYLNFEHDPYPLIIVTDIWPNYIRGVNLHYLTFNYVRRLLNMHCDNQMFSYFNIRNDQFFVNSFRTYKRQGIRQIKKLDCAFLLNVLGSVMSFDPAQIEQMRVYVKEQLQRQPNQSADQMTSRYMNMQRGNEGQGFVPPQ